VRCSIDGAACDQSQFVLQLSLLFGQRSSNRCRFHTDILLDSGEEAEASEEESEHGINVGNYAYDDDYPEAAPETTGQELMEIDGMVLRELRAPDGIDTN
jgi:hypothetical protein